MTRTIAYGKEDDLPRGNVIAVVGVVLSLLIVIPLLPLIGMICGIVGYRRAPRAGGAIAARVAVVLGLVVSSIQFAVIAGTVQQYFTQKRVAPVVDQTGQLVMLLGTYNTRALQGQCTENVTPVELAAAADHIDDLGPLRNVNKWYGGKERDKRNTVVVEAAILTDKKHEALVATWVKRDGRFLLDDLSFKPLDIEPSTQPAASTAN